MVRVTSVVGQTRSLSRLLIDSSIVRQAPGACREAGTLTDLSFLADDAADALELLGHAVVGSGDVVEGVGDLALHAQPIGRQADRKIAVTQGVKCG